MKLKPIGYLSCSEDKNACVFYKKAPNYLVNPIPIYTKEDLRAWLENEIEQNGHKETTVKKCFEKLLAELEGERK